MIIRLLSLILVGTVVLTCEAQLFRRRWECQYQYQYQPSYNHAPVATKKLPVSTDTRLPGPRAHGVASITGCNCAMCMAISIRSHLASSHGIDVDRYGGWNAQDWYLIHDNIHNLERLVFEPTPQPLVERMIKIADPQPDEMFLDLGSGDGRILIAAARHGCKRVIGYELNPELVNQSKNKAMQAGVHVTVNQKSFLTLNLKSVAVVTVYLDEPMLKRTMRNLQTMRSGGRIVSYAHPLPGVAVQEVYWYPQGTLYFYRTPLED